MKERAASRHTSLQSIVMLAGLVAVGLTGSMGTDPARTSDTLALRVRSGKVADVAALGQAAQASPFKFKVDGYYDCLLYTSPSPRDS